MAIYFLEDIIQDSERLRKERAELSNELYTCMSSLSKLRIYKENMEAELTSEIEEFRYKLGCSQLALKDRESLISQLRAQIDDLNYNLQSKVKAELHHLHFVKSEDDKSFGWLQVQNQELVCNLFLPKRNFCFCLNLENIIEQ